MPVRLRLIAAACAVAMLPVSADAQLFWNPPDFSGTPVRGDEPGIGLPLPGATPAELDAYLLWNMRAGLNVAALQCQFSPTLMTVRNYNDVLRQHGKELNSAYATLNGYFKRLAGKDRSSTQQGQVAFDQFTTRTYNGFSTLHAQLGFCETAARIGRDALGQPKGSLMLTARARMREFRNSLVPVGDHVFGIPRVAMQPLPPYVDPCWDYVKNRKRKHCDAV